MEGLSEGDLRRECLRCLRRSISICARELEETEGEEKIKWANCLAKQVSALVSLTRVMGRTEAEEDLATFLARLRRRLPKKFRGLVDASWERRR
ncbi:hypothetical protein DRO56_02980 [Candidatus Bathyarchaeota archaeon]|nr:MAG: hypothetical protein DRO56_02980 [Candidatus Bathyarchaeota archaeon]